MELFLFHYFESSQGPFRNLSSLSHEEAVKIMRQLKEKDVFASRRAKDYLLIRRELENRACRMFVEKGGKPRSSFPHYLTLGPCEWLKSWYKEGMELIIPLSEIDDDIISFTYGDLFPTMRFKDGKPYREQIYRKSEIITIIEKYGYPQQWNKDGEKGPERYIEVQIWDDEIVHKYNCWICSRDCTSIVKG